MLSSACAEEAFERELMWEGEYVRLWREAGTEIELDDWCPGTLSHVDRFTLFAMDSMGSDDHRPIDYSVLESPAEDYFPGCAGGVGCTVDAQVLSPFLPHDHEIVHAVRDRSGSSPRFFEEGAANYWGDLRFESRSLLYDVRIDELPTASDVYAASWSRQLTLAEYEVATQFTAFLVDAFGTEANVEFSLRTTEGTSRQRAEALFEETFGVSIANALEMHAAEWPSCSYESARSSAYDCAADAILVCDAAAPRVQVFDFDVSCADPSVVGPREDKVWRDVVFEFAGPGPHEVVADFPTTAEKVESFVYVKRCTTHCGEADATEVPKQHDGYPVSGLEIPEPGRYVVRMYRSAMYPGPVSLVWTCDPP